MAQAPTNRQLHAAATSCQLHAAAASNIFLGYTTQQLLIAMLLHWSALRLRYCSTEWETKGDRKHTKTRSPDLTDLLSSWCHQSLQVRIYIVPYASQSCGLYVFSLAGM